MTDTAAPTDSPPADDGATVDPATPSPELTAALARYAELLGPLPDVLATADVGDLGELLDAAKGVYLDALPALPTSRDGVLGELTALAPRIIAARALADALYERRNHVWDRGRNLPAHATEAPPAADSDDGEAPPAVRPVTFAAMAGASGVSETLVINRPSARDARKAKSNR